MICILGYAGILSELAFNVFSRDWHLAAVSVGVFIIHTVFYYLGRVAGRFHLAVILYSIVNNFIFSFHFYYSEGINGGTILVYVLSFYLIILVSPKATYKLWLLLNVFFVAASLSIQFAFPELIPDSFRSEESRYLHLFFTYFVVIMFIYFGTTFIKKKYETERLVAEERARAIRNQNKMLLLQNAEFQRLNAEKAKLFSIVAHDLRAPLNSIQNYLQFLREFDLDPQEKEDVEAQLLESTRITSEMLVNLLTWGQSQMGGISVNIQRVNLLQSVLNTIEMESSLAAMKGIDFGYRIDPHLDLLADVNVLQLIIRNLLHNSVKFTEEGGRIFLEALKVEDECIINISDSGIGISDEQKAKIFSSGLKSGKGTHNENGMGLGLVLCKEFATRMNGTISFNSSEGEGSVFSLRLKC